MGGVSHPDARLLIERVGVAAQSQPSASSCGLLDDLRHALD